jgi:DNA-directed RNA polymerase specialized sigma24 family protein
MASTPRRRSDTELVARCLQAKRGAKQEFFDRFWTPLRRHVRSRLRGEPDRNHRAEQLAEDALLSLWDNDMRRLREYNPELASLPTFLNVVANDLIAQDLRKRVRRRLLLPKCISRTSRWIGTATNRAKSRRGRSCSLP